MDVKQVEFIVHGVTFCATFPSQLGRQTGCLCSYDADYELAASVITDLWVHDPVWLLESANQGRSHHAIEDTSISFDGERVVFADVYLGEGSLDRKFFEALVLKFSQVTVAALGAQHFEYWLSKLDHNVRKRLLGAE